MVCQRHGRCVLTTFDIITVALFWVVTLHTVYVNWLSSHSVRDNNSNPVLPVVLHVAAQGFKSISAFWLLCCSCWGDSVFFTWGAMTYSPLVILMHGVLCRQWLLWLEISLCEPAGCQPKVSSSHRRGAAKQKHISQKISWTVHSRLWHLLQSPLLTLNKLFLHLLKKHMQPFL